MPTIFELKEQSATETPLLLFDCELGSGQVEHWSTHNVVSGGITYDARVLQHNLFAIQTSSDQGTDTIPRVSLTLANADSHFSELERTAGWKGAKLKVQFVFFDLRQGVPASESLILFQGLVNPPDEITESTFRLSAINRMSMQRVLLPQVRIQRRCPWEFPATTAERGEGVHGGEEGAYSRFFRCGYSPDIDGGCGNLNGGQPFASCGYTRADCTARGMFNQDATLTPTRRFGGIEFVPSSIQVRTYGEKSTHLSAVSANMARYNDFVPLIYGTAWYTPPVVFSRNDGNLTHFEVLLGMGELDGVLKVLVNDIEIPLGQAGANMTGTGWFGIVTLGNRTGSFNLDFPGGDPYGSMAMLSVVVPNRINDGRSLPDIRVLIHGLKLPHYNTDGSFLKLEFTNNPSWVLLDILRRSGWKMSEIDLGSFAEAAAFCDEQIQTQDLNGNVISIARFQCNLVLQKRRSAADAIRGIRNGSRLYLTYGNGGMLQLSVENTIALQQSTKPEWSNAKDTLNGGWPSYEFGDGSSGFSGILRRANGEASVRLWSRSTIETPNRFAVEFQDGLNEFQQDSFSLVDVEDVARTGQEITAPLSALGLPNYDQTARILKFNLDKAILGNTYVEFETSVRALGLRPGDIITLTYLKEGFNRQPFRVIGIAPGLNFQTMVITAQIHQDSWYADTNGQVPGDSRGGRQPGSGIGLPKPLVGSVLDENGDVQFEVAEKPVSTADGVSNIEATVSFLAPPGLDTSLVGIPLLSMAPTIGSSGTLPGGETLYYALSAVDGTGQESAISFIVRAAIPTGSDTNSVTLSGLSFAPQATGFHVYRGTNPAQLYRIASNCPLAATFTDTGLPPELSTPPDPNYDHANFYWRLELQPEYAATAHTIDSIGNGTLQMVADAYKGMLARITRGKGKGQERRVSSNSTDLLNLTSKWDIEPDATSSFVVAESSWRFGATAQSSPVSFEIPNRTGAVLHISGRAANVNDVESAPELATVTRWTIGGAGHADSDVPPQPVFGLGLSPATGGTVELAGIGFADLTNTRTVTSGTLTLYYWDELGGPSAHSLGAAIGTDDTTISLTPAGGAQPGDAIQIDAEILRVEEILDGGLQYGVTRAIHGSSAAAHAAGAVIYHLARRVVIVPFAPDFFGSPFSGNWSYPIYLPNVRIVSSEFFVTNDRGDSELSGIALTQTLDYGLRTLSRGQFSFQVEGFLAVQDDTAPALVVDAPHSVRDVFAIVKQAPTGSPIELRLRCNGTAYCSLSIPTGATISNTVNGLSLLPLSSGANLSLDIVSVGQDDPGSDLTVIVRL